ncbi:MAG: GNAT family N-acetyltransferase [Mycobacteriales bacterium]
MSWPLHDLVLRAPDLELRGMTEQWARRLADVVPDDLEHHPRLAHFSAGTDVLQAYWRNNGRWLPSDWVAQFVVLHQGEPIGLQALEGKDFAAGRTVDTHSWLVLSARGQGLGKQMRAAVLALAFDHLGARAAVTEAWSDNASSLGVSRSLGYRDSHRETREDGRVLQHLTLTAWSSPWAVEISGVVACLPYFGL